jgi:uncharacterized protein (TIGR02246 family)
VFETLDRYFESLRAQDWSRLAECLAEDVHRTGPYLDVVEGRDAYVAFLEAVIPTLPNYELRVLRTRALGDAAALVELTETLHVDGARTTVPEALVFDFEASQRIARVAVYIMQAPAARERDPGAARAGGDAR